MRGIVHRLQAEMRSNAPAAALGGLILLASLIYVPISWDALNYFDPPKRFLWALVALILAGVWSRRESRLDHGPLFLSLGLLAWLVIRTFLKSRPDIELEVLFAWILPILLFILAGGLDRTRGVWMMGGCLVLAGVIQAGLMILQRFGVDPLFFDTTSSMDYKPGRMIGTIGYQNQAVDFLALCGTGIFFLSRSSLPRLALLAALLMVAGFTGNRGGVLAFTVALWVSHLLLVFLHGGRWSRQKKWVVTGSLALGICGLVGVLALIPETGSRFREVLVDFRHSPAIGSRVLMARVGFDLFRERPWTGWGAGEYAFQYLDRLGTVLPHEKTHEVLKHVVFAREAHHDYVQFAAEFGMVGVLLFAALLSAAVVRFGRSRGLYPLEVSAAGFVLAYMGVSALVSFPWQTSLAGPLAGFLLGWLWPRVPDLRHTQVSPGLLQAVLSQTIKAVLLVLSLILVGWYGWDAFLNTAVPNKLAMDGPREAERLLPRCAYRYHALVGAVYATQGADREAENELLHAQWGYRDIPLWNNLGYVLVKRHKWREAREVYEKWARCGLDHSNALLNVSVACEQTGRFREAAETLTRKFALWSPSSPTEIKRLAVLQLQSGDPQGARNTLQTYEQNWAVSDSRTVAEIENLAGSIDVVLGDQHNAEKRFRAALDKNPDLESARRNLESLPVAQN